MNKIMNKKQTNKRKRTVQNETRRSKEDNVCACIYIIKPETTWISIVHRRIYSIM